MTAQPSIPRLALDWHRSGRGAVLATVIETWGSAPRGIGSQLVIDGNGAMEGSVSGGCVEGAVVLEAIEALGDKEPKILTYGVSDDDAFAVGLACGGTIRILVQPVGAVMPEDVLADLVAGIEDHVPVACVSDLKSGRVSLARAPDYPDRFRLERSGIEDDEATFVAVFAPPLRLIIVGAVHIAQPLVAFARLAGFDPTLIDPRPAFGASSRFPGETIVEDWPDEAMKSLAPDARTAIVTLTHDPKLDDPALMQAFDSDAFYIGCLGSKRTHAKRVERLIAAGVKDTDIARIHAPVGLDLGGRKPAEIALSIMAQITQVLRKG